jgi:deferrochelatase/peroxidase EfeB
MTELDLADIQGGILRAYGRQGFPKARCFFLTVRDPAKGRDFVERLRPRITTAARWKNPDRGEALVRTRNPRVKDVVRAEGVPDYPGEVQLMKPEVTFNIAFTFFGLVALEVPTRTLRAMPDEFIDGMARRAPILGDEKFLETRDAVWKRSEGKNRVHILVQLNAEMNKDGTPIDALERETLWLRELCDDSDGGVVLLTGNGPDPDGAPWQEMSAVLAPGGDGLTPTNKEHFGLSDGFGDPVFEGQLSGEAERLRAIGGGKILNDGSWAPVATGEFLLGYPDEAQEVPGAAMPIEFSRNGTFMAYRKLHENVGSFAAFIDEAGARYARTFGITHEGEARETVKAKMVGRWSDGIPLMAAPTFQDWLAFRKELADAHTADDKPKLAQLALRYTDFKYKLDPDGTACPVTSHMRRANPRDMLDPNFLSPNVKISDSALVNRRRILRRGLPYGQVDPAAPNDANQQGIIFMAICSSLFRQFEFVQQQWMEYGLDFNAGSDTCPIIGRHDEKTAKLVVVTDPKTGRQPFVADGIPQLVETRGGDYFFIPSMTALRMIGMGIVDPT